MDLQNKIITFAPKMTENLKDKTAKGLFWGALNSGVTQVIGVIVGIVLARLLTPADYGIVGVLTIFSALAYMLQTSGLGTGLINIKNPTDNDYNSVFWFNILVSSVLYVVLFLCAPLISDFFHQDCLINVSRVLFLTLPLSALSNTSGTYLTKNMMNREIAIIGVTSFILSGLVGVLMAFCGYSYWSLVGQQLVSAIVVLIGRYYYVRWLPNLRVDFKPVMRMYRFCIKLLITNICYVINSQMLTFFLGRLLPIQAVGNYSQANKWNVMANSIISGAVGQIAQTVFVSVSDEKEREVRVFRKLLRFTAFFSFPCMFGLAVVAPEFILLTIGDKWIESILILQILCIGGAFAPFYTLYFNLVLSKGHSGLVLLCHGGQMVIQLLLLLLLYKEGIVSIVLAYSILTIMWLFVWQMAGKSLINLCFIDALKDVVPFLVVSLFVMAVTYISTTGITNLFFLLIARILMAALLYAGIMKLLQAKVMDECIAFIRKKR